jgi:segregation and condensation protein B
MSDTLSRGAQRIEALLFVAGEAVSKKELAALLKEPVETIDTYVQEISEQLHGHGITVVVTDTHVQLTTSPSVADYLRQFQKEEQPKLSKAAAETLAIIAYRGPLSRYDIDVLRGVDSAAMVRQLVRRGTVRQIQQAGKTPLYDISEAFLLHMGVERREDLPQFAELSNNERIQQLLETSSS